MNTGINKDKYRGEDVQLKLPGVDALVKIILQKGRGCKIFKRDLLAAYKQVPVCIGTIHLLGYTFEGKFYFDLTLPMGLTNSAYICQRVTNALMYIYQQEGYAGTNYLDDLAAAELQDLVDQAYQILSDILQEAGAREALDKAVVPSTRILFVGILIDTILLRLEIDQERLALIKGELQMCLLKETATLKQLQSLVGKLSFCATVVKSGRVFFQRILNFMRTADFKLRAKLTAEVRADIQWWVRFMPFFNGLSVMPNPRWTGPNRLFATDATLQAAGGWSDGQYFHVRFPMAIVNDQRYMINELEALALLAGLKPC